MTSVPDRQQGRALSLLEERGIVRLSELTKAGVTATTVSRMKEKGLILRLGRGLYQLPLPDRIRPVLRRSPVNRACL